MSTHNIRFYGEIWKIIPKFLVSPNTLLINHYQQMQSILSSCVILQIRYWRDSDDIRNAQDINCEKRTYGHIYQLQQNTLYHLRVLGYSMGGDGKMSSPQTLFSLMSKFTVVIFKVCGETDADKQCLLFHLLDTLLYGKKKTLFRIITGILKEFSR